MAFKIAVIVVVIGVVLLATLALRPMDSEVSAQAAEAAALRWVDNNGLPEAPRRDEGEWEVDVVRPNGSLVEVTIGDELELKGLDEELGPGGTRAPDELTGPARERAIRAATAAVGPGRVLSAERDVPLEVEVKIQRPEGVVEVELDPELRVVEIEREDSADE